MLVIFNQSNNGAFSFHMLLLVFYPTRHLWKNCRENFGQRRSK